MYIKTPFMELNLETAISLKTMKFQLAVRKIILLYRLDNFDTNPALVFL